MGFFSKIKEGLKKTKDSVFGQVHELFKNMRKVDEELLEELEELLIMADVGYASSEKIISELRNELTEQKIQGGDEALEILKKKKKKMMMMMMRRMRMRRRRKMMNYLPFS